MKRVLCLVGAVLLSACGMVPLVPKEDLTPTSGPSVYLGNPFTFVPPSGPTARIPLTLSAGEYAPVMKDKDGTYYRGPSRCVVQKEWKGTFLRDGGIWLPTAGKGMRPRIYVYEANTPSDSEQSTKDNGQLNTTVNTIQAIPTRTPAIVAGLGAGLGFAIVGALAQVDPTRVLFITDPLPVAVDIETQLKSQ